MPNEQAVESNIPDSKEEANDDSSLWEVGSEAQESDEQPKKDNREPSALGRKVKVLEDSIGDVRSAMSRIESLLADRVYAPQSLSEQAVSELDDETPVYTAKDVLTVLKAEERKEQERRSKYAGRYLATVDSQIDDMHDEVKRELLENKHLYPTYSDYTNPSADALANYYLAKSNILQGKVSGSAPNVRGKINRPMGVAATTRQTETHKAPKPLDEVSLKFIKALGEQPDAEWVQKSVSREDEVWDKGK
jgi:hypothetical protein